ncbi:MAG: hypothetical protein NTY48_03210 [Candidatus Diapherotrites archaeon]|nr:hypothetical protein [Candidatus Diapherotrites archaeon]
MFSGENDEPNYNPGGGPTGGGQKPRGIFPDDLKMPQMPSIPRDINISVSPEIKSGAKKLITIIVVIVIIAIIGIAGYSYFSAQKEVTILIKTTDGASVNAALTLRGVESQTLAVLTPTGTSSRFSAKLWAGNYLANITAAGYKTTSETITVGGDNNDTFTIVVTRDLKAELTSEIDTKEIFEGQTVLGRVKVVNTGTEFNETDISASATTPLQIILNTDKESTISRDGSAYIDFNLQIKPGTNVKTEGKASITFKIKGTSIASKIEDIRIMPSVKTQDITLTASLTNTTLVAGEEKSFAIKIQNQNKTIPLQEIKVEVVPDPDFDGNLNWFRFSSPNQNELYSTTIASIDPTKSEIVTLYVTPPVSSKKGAEFKGVLKISSLSINGEITKPISFAVGTDKKVQINLVGVDKPFTINCVQSTGICETKTLGNSEVYLENKGNIDVGPIKVQMDMSNQNVTANCPYYLLKVSTEESENDTVTLLIE